MKKILIVDDDPMYLVLIQDIINELGHISIKSSNGKRALDILFDNPEISLLITDMMMPEMDGRELVRILRGNESFANLPVIIISSVVSIKEIRDIMNLGASVFIAKPIDRKILGEEIDRMF